MVSWVVGLLIGLMLAMKIVAIGVLVIACVGVWAILRLIFRSVSKVSGKSARSSQRPKTEASMDYAQRPQFRYDNVQPVMRAESAASLDRRGSSSGRRRSSAWVFWGVIGLVLAFVFLGARRGRIEQRFASAPAERAKEVNVTKRSDKRSKAPVTNPEPTVIKTALTPKPTQPAIFTCTVVGTGETLEFAKEDACDKAWEKIVGYLGEAQPSLEWTPSKDFVQRHLARNWGADEAVDLEEVGRVIQIPLHVDLTAQDRDLIVQKNKQFRTELRMGWLARLVAGLVVLLAAVAAYVRLDEWSKGYYTGALRLAAAAFLIVSVAGVLFLVRH